MSRAARLTLGTLAVLVVIAVAAFAVDRWAHARTETRIEEEVAAAVAGIEGLDAHVGGALFLPQVLTGTMDEVRIAADGVTYNGLTATDVEVVGTGVPVETPGTVERIDAAATLDDEALATVVDSSGDLPEAVTVTVDDGELVAQAEVLGVMLEAALDPVVTDGELRLDPQRFTLGGLEIDASGLPLDLLGDLGALTVSTDALPQGMTIEAVEVLDGGVRLTLGGTDVSLP